MNFSQKYTIFAVTGHRDIDKSAIKPIKYRLRSIFKRYMGFKSPKEFILISPLAEGADMLVAEVVKEFDIKLWVIIPFKERCYLRTFQSRHSQKLYKKLKKYAFRFDVLNCDPYKKTNRCYRLLGERIVDMSDILIALWDGIDNGKEGGTSQTIFYARRKKRKVIVIDTLRINCDII